MKFKSKIVSIIILLLLFLGISLLHFNCSSNHKSSSSETSLYLNHNDTVKYVGMNVCKGCHPDKYETFIQTGMGMSFEAANRKKSAAKFDKHSVIYDAQLNFYYKPYFQNDIMYIMEYRMEGKDTIHKRIEKVDFIIGSGMHTNSHMHNENGYFFQMPLTYYTQKARWDLPPGFENGHNSRFNRTIELECMSCHNSYPNFMSGSKNKFLSVPQGIDCERCHGPGEIHVQEKQLGHIIDTANQIDYSIVNPKKLSYDLQVDVCQRCHLQGDAVLAEGKSFFDFKPGQKLSDYINVFLPRYKGNNEQFIMASHADRLKQSKCFIESTKLKINTNQKTYSNSKVINNQVSSLTCISCHNPHVSIKVTGNNQYNNACKSCHQNNKQVNLPSCTESLKTRNIQQDNCWACHMPKSGTIDIPHVTVHDHRIQIPVKRKEIKAIQTFIGLAAVNNPNPDPHTIAEGYLSYYEKFETKNQYLDSASRYFSMKGNYSPAHYFNNMIRLYFLKEDYQSLINTAEKEQATYSKDAWTNYRIGEAYAYQNQTEKAYIHYQLACKQAPYILEFRNKLGGMESAKGDYSAAKKTYEFILQENPKFVAALSNLGFLFTLEQRNEEAMKLYDRAIALDPDYEKALENKASLLFQLNKNDETIIILKRILKLNPRNEKIKVALKQLNGI